MRFLQTFTTFPKKHLGYVLVILPILAYYLNWAANPSYWFQSDPGTWYFLDSLSAFKGQSYTYVDHPGTPLHLIGSFLLALTYPFFNTSTEFIAFHLRRPEIFFFMAHTFLAVMNGITAIVFYHAVSTTLKHARMLAGIALSWAYFGFHIYSYHSIAFWSQNSLNFAFGTLWLLWLFLEIRKDRTLSKSKVFLLGLAAGILTVAQFYFATWLISGIVTLWIFALRLGKSRLEAGKDALWFTFGGAWGIISMLIPIYKEIPRFVNWFSRNLTHQGLYGTGEKGIYSLELIPISLHYWWTTIPLLLILLVGVWIVILALGFIIRKNAIKISPSLFAMTVGLFLQTAILMAGLSKMVTRLRHSLSIAAVAPVLLFLALALLEKTKWGKTWGHYALYATLLLAAVWTLPEKMQIQQKSSLVEYQAAVARSQTIDNLAKLKKVDDSAIVVVYSSGTPMKCAGLLMADNWLQKFGAEIAKICPNQYAIYDFNINIEFNYSTPHEVTVLKDIPWDLVVWPGNGSRVPQYLLATGAKNIPNSWNNRSKWFFMRAEYP